MATTKAQHKVESALLLDAVVAEGATTLKLLASEDQTLLIRRNAFLVVNLGLHAVNRISRLSLKSDGLASQSLDENLHLVLVLNESSQLYSNNNSK